MRAFFTMENSENMVNVEYHIDNNPENEIIIDSVNTINQKDLSCGYINRIREQMKKRGIK